MAATSTPHARGCANAADCGSSTSSTGSRAGALSSFLPHLLREVSRRSATERASHACASRDAACPLHRLSAVFPPRCAALRERGYKLTALPAPHRAPLDPVERIAAFMAGFSLEA